MGQPGTTSLDARSRANPAGKSGAALSVTWPAGSSGCFRALTTHRSVHEWGGAPMAVVQNVGRANALLAAEPAGWMETLGARITEAEPGRVVLELETGPQHRHGGGVVQGGV